MEEMNFGAKINAHYPPKNCPSGFPIFKCLIKKKLLRLCYELFHMTD